MMQKNMQGLSSVPVLCLLCSDRQRPSQMLVYQRALTMAAFECTLDFMPGACLVCLLRGCVHRQHLWWRPLAGRW